VQCYARSGVPFCPISLQVNKANIWYDNWQAESAMGEQATTLLTGVGVQKGV